MILYYYSLTIYVKKERKDWGPFFVMRQVAYVELMTEGHGNLVRVACVEKGKLLVDVDERTSGLNYKQNVVLRRNLLDCRARNAIDLCHWSVLAKPHIKKKHAVVLANDLGSSDAAYEYCSRVDI